MLPAEVGFFQLIFNMVVCFLVLGLGGTEAGLPQAQESEWQEGKRAACATSPSHEMPQLLTFQLHLLQCLALVPSIMMAIITSPRQLHILAVN